MLSPVSVEALPRDLPRRLFTVDEVMQMVEQGILDEDEHVELLEGELVVVTPQGPRHGATVAHLQERLGEAYRGTGHVRAQLPFVAGPHSLPEPDLAVVSGRPLDYRHRHPAASDAHMVVEVAHTSHGLDRRKARIYAAAGAPVYWVVDLERRQVEVFTAPTPDGYHRHEVLSADRELELPGLGLHWPVADVVGPP